METCSSCSAISRVPTSTSRLKAGRRRGQCLCQCRGMMQPHTSRAAAAGLRRLEALPVKAKRRSALGAELGLDQ